MFYLEYTGSNLVKVFALRKQFGELFLAKSVKPVPKCEAFGWLNETVCKAKPQQTPSPVVPTKQKAIVKRRLLFLFYLEYTGSNLVKVFALRKQFGELFLAKSVKPVPKCEAFGWLNETVCKAKPQQTPSPVVPTKQKAIVFWRLLFCFIFYKFAK